MSTKYKVLVTATNYSLLCADAKRMLEEAGCEIIENQLGRPHTFEELAPLVADIDGVVAGVDTWDEAIFKLAPKLKGIARFGVGVDNIDLAKAREYGIKVANVPGGNANAVAELTIGLILSMLRNIPTLERSARRGYWDRTVGTELAERTVGLLGLGNIAQMVAKKLQGFDVETSLTINIQMKRRRRHSGSSLCPLMKYSLRATSSACICLVLRKPII